jgi:SulP family sulfate permease
LRNAIAGVICAIVSLVFSLSYATLIFSGPLAPWLAYGMAATFVTATIGAIVMASRSSLPFALASPDASTSAMTAALVGALASRLVAEGAGDRLLGPTLMALPLTGALVGVTLCGLGIARAGRAVRFVPYPVIGGFVGATGWLVTAGAVQVMTGYRLGLVGIGHFLDGLTLTKLAAGAAVAAVLLICKPRFKGPFAQPTQLLACAVALYAGLTLFGISLTEAQANGWMFQPPSAAAFAFPWDFDEWRRFPWRFLPALSADFVAVMFVAAVSILLNVAGLEVTAKREADLDRELTTAGLSNLVAAAFGGYVNGVPLSRSTLAFKLAGDSRIPSLCVGASSLAMIGINPLSRLCTEVCCRWIVAQSWFRPALPLADRVVASAVTLGVHLARHHRADNYQLGLCSRHSGRHPDWLCNFRV